MMKNKMVVRTVVIKGDVIIITENVKKFKTKQE
jgi:hypothetical protein